jgi:hypothetical protein
MISQLRIYTIKPGMMDEWLKLFNDQLVPIHRDQNIRLDGVWVNTEADEFVWIRSFKDEEEMASQVDHYTASPARKALGDQPGNYIVKTEVRILRSVDAATKGS